MTAERLILFGELLDAMKDSYSFSGVVEVLLAQLQKDPIAGAYLDAASAKINVDAGEYTYSDYMQTIALFLN